MSDAFDTDVLVAGAGPTGLTLAGQLAARGVRVRVIDVDIERAADTVRPLFALYIGGMGARQTNFHFDVFVRLGFEDVARKVQELYLDGHKAEAIAAVPTTLVEKVALVGPLAKIRDDIAAWQGSMATTLVVWPLSPAGLGDQAALSTVRAMAEVVL